MKLTQGLTGRRNLMKMMFASILGIIISSPVKALAAAQQWWTPTPTMDAITAIRTRRSVRSYTDQEVSDAQVKELLGAAMSAPSAGNEQPWEFVIIRDKDTLEKVSGINRFADYAKNAPVCILVCGNLNRDKYGGYWVEDAAAATQNILLAAHAMGLGAVWTGIYPMGDRIQGFRDLIDAPQNIVPLALVVIGHPKNSPSPIDRFDENKVHRERWAA